MYRHCPIEGLTGIVAYDAEAKAVMDNLMAGASRTIPVTARPDCYV